MIAEMRNELEFFLLKSCCDWLKTLRSRLESLPTGTDSSSVHTFKDNLSSPSLTHLSLVHRENKNHKIALVVLGVSKR